MNRAIAITVIANSAVQEMVAENSIECFVLCFRCCRRVCQDSHVLPHRCGACSDQITIDFDNAGVAGLDWAKLWFVTNLGQFHTTTIYDVDQSLTQRGLVHDAIDRYPKRWRWFCVMNLTGSIGVGVKTGSLDCLEHGGYFLHKSIDSIRTRNLQAGSGWNLFRGC